MCCEYWEEKPSVCVLKCSSHWAMYITNILGLNDTYGLLLFMSGTL